MPSRRLQAGGQGDGRLARRAGDDDLFGAKVAFHAQHLVDEKGRHEQRAQQQDAVLVLGTVQGVGIGGGVGRIERREPFPVRRTVEHAMRGGPSRRDDEVRAHREEPVNAASLRHLWMRGSHDVGEPHHRDAAPSLVGWKEPPVPQQISHLGVGDVVGGQGKAVDAEQDAPIGKGRHRLLHQSVLIDGISANFERLAAGHVGPPA